MFTLPPTMTDSEPSATEHDPELSRFLDRVVELSAERHVHGPDALLSALDGLGEEYRGLARYRTEKALTQSFEAFAEKRLSLVDEGAEYALAGDEVVLLSMALGESAPLAFGALKRTLIRLSAVLLEEDVPAAFGRVLKRLRHLARQHADTELEAWVRGVVDALPAD